MEPVSTCVLDTGSSLAAKNTLFCVAVLLTGVVMDFFSANDHYFRTIL
jgi:hypothetical protein